MSSKVLVVRVDGYISSHLVITMQEAGNSAIVFNNLLRGLADVIVNHLGWLLKPDRHGRHFQC